MDIETLLKDSLDRHLTRKDGRTPPNLEESIRYSLLAPGKRIRPRLMLTCSEMVGISPEKTVPAALALEMIHCFTLIHDDLPCMDDDDFRRGMPSNHKKFGESIALLAGDGLLALAVDVFLDSSIEPKPLIAGLKRLIWAAGPRGVIGGQAAEALLGAHSSLNELRSMHAQKTGALFSAAILVPKDFAEISDDSEKGQILTSFADELGVAFQVADDLEDAAEVQGNADPTSVLSYLSADEAAQITVRALQSSSENLRSIWGQKAEGMRKISDEVARKIELALVALSKTTSPSLNR